MNNKPQSRSKKSLRFFVCYKEGHFKIEFPKKRKRCRDKERDGTITKAYIAHDGYEKCRSTYNG